MHITFVRHGQSTGNAGIPATDLALMPLTALGQQQAEDVAASWQSGPSRVVSSPYVRARQTAEPTSQRFAIAPVDVWPIHEFTYLEPSRWNGTSREERRPVVDAYWAKADPGYVDGPGAESFSDVLRRAEDALARLVALRSPDAAGKGTDVALFSHGQFIQAVRMTLMFPGASDAQKMASFWPFDQRSPVRNGQKVELAWGHGGLKLVETGAPADLDSA